MTATELDAIEARARAFRDEQEAGSVGGTMAQLADVDVPRLVAAVRELRAVAAKCEWEGERVDAREEGDSWVLTCPCCKSTVILGHAPDCALAAALGKP